MVKISVSSEKHQAAYEQNAISSTAMESLIQLNPPVAQGVCFQNMQNQQEISIEATFGVSWVMLAR
jgi:hypothetical protein